MTAKSYRLGGIGEVERGWKAEKKRQKGKAKDAASVETEACYGKCVETH